MRDTILKVLKDLSRDKAVWFKKPLLEIFSKLPIKSIRWHDYKGHVVSLTNE